MKDRFCAGASARRSSAVRTLANRACLTNCSATTAPSSRPSPAPLATPLRPPPCDVNVRCISGQGMEALKDAIKELVWAGEIKAEMLQVMINSRHQEALKRARQAAQQTIEAMRSDLTLELVATDLRIAVNAIGEIVGRTTTEDLLDSIFSQFCIGK